MQPIDQPLLPRGQAASVLTPALGTPWDLTALREPQSPGHPILPDPLVPSGPDGRDPVENDEGHPLTPSDPALDLRIPDSHPILPSEDMKTYGELVKRMVHSLGLLIVQKQQEAKDAICDTEQCDMSTPVALPIIGMLVETAKSSWPKPMPMPISLRHLNHMYKL